MGESPEEVKSWFCQAVIFSFGTYIAFFVENKIHLCLKCWYCYNPNGAIYGSNHL